MPAQTAKAIFQVSTPDLLRELYELLALFKADKAIVDSFEQEMKVESSREDPLISLRWAAIKALALKLLIDTAAKNRYRADAHDLVELPSGKKAVGPWDVAVGTLTVNGEAKPLSLRESCNKIVHAASIDLGGSEVTAISGVVVTRGTYKGAEWVAEISVLQYVRASLFNIFGGVDFPRGNISF